MHAHDRLIQALTDRSVYEHPTTELAKRHFFCQEKLRLNRRLAPQLYLDVVALYGTPERPRWHGPGAPIEYAVQMKQFAQDTLLSHLIEAGTLHAARVIEAGYTVMVDATFLKRAHRDAFRHLAAQLGMPFAILAFCADAETLRRRVAQRSTQGTDASEADLAVLHGQFAALEPLTASEQAYALSIDTNAPQALERLLAAIRAMGEEL